MRFEQQVAVVTGGAGGLGRAVVQRLADEGAIVVVFDLDEAAMAAIVRAGKGAGPAIGCARVDVTDEASVAGGIDRVVAEHGRLDIVVNCAGIIGPTNLKVTQVDAAAFDATLAVNLRGSFLVAKHAVRAMAPRNYGRILLVASIAGKEGNAGMSPYSASKAGVIGLAKAVGKECAETGITVNALAPAAIRTPMLEHADPAAVKYMTDRIPMRRYGTLAEVAAIAAWIVSAEASFNTGAVFDLSGGRATY
jgi:3-oxoacyl-[acyl-carrier protein] reductase